MMMGMGKRGIRSDAAPRIGRVRGCLYACAVTIRTLLLMAAVAILTLPITLALSNPDAGADRVGALIAAGLVLLGLGLPLVSIVLARVDWNASTAVLDLPATSPPDVSWREPRTLVRPLAYGATMLTLGGAAAVLMALLTIASVVAILSPLLTTIGDRADIGPFTITTIPQAFIAAALGVAVLVGLAVLAPVLAGVHARATRQMLTPPEQRLARDLDRTSRSRTRLVRAFDVERRRIERDLHDGVQPQLMSVSMTLGLALADMAQDAPGRDDVLRAQDQARTALESLRQFVRNIHPQVLIDHGLGAAIGELADTLPMPITIDDRLDARLPADAETNLYFCIAELFTNIVKHSGATRAEAQLVRDPGTDLVQVVVSDDGIGGAGTVQEAGTGLDGIADRIAAFDGTLTIDSPLGGPTVITIGIAAAAEGVGV